MLHVLYGPDTFSRRGALQRLKVELDGDGMLQNSTAVFDAAQASPQEVVAACETAPFLSQHRLVIVEGLLQQGGAARPGRRPRKRAAAEAPGIGPWQPLIDCLDRLPPTTTLVVVDGNVPAGAPLLEALKGKGRLQHFPKLDRKALPAWVQRRAQELGIRIEHRVAALLADLVGDDLWVLAGELDKLAAYADGQPIREEDVRALVSAVREASVFPLVDAIVEGRAAVALKLLAQMLAQGQTPAYVFAMVQRQYRNLAIAREMLDAGASAARIGERLGVGSYALERLLDQAARYTLPRIREAFRRLLEADLSIKRGTYDDELALELLTQELAAA